MELKYQDLLIIVIIGDVGYNVYLIDQDKWLFGKNKQGCFEDKLYGANPQALLFDQSLVYIEHIFLRPLLY